MASSSPGSLGFSPGNIIEDRYRVISLLGRGGMGEVYGADDLKLGQRVALKFLPKERGTNPVFREQLYAEVRIARGLSHPNICRVYDVGESDGRVFLSMEFVDGEDLASLLRRIGRLPDDKAVEIAQQLCSGLAAAHGSGVLHRDLKPSNVMLDGQGRARITDFGLAIATEEAGAKAGTAGTPGYLAPELLSGGTPSVQSDLYALGLVLYEIFTGKRAFEAATFEEMYRKQTETDPTPPTNVVKTLDANVERAILRCLEKDPAKRPRSAESVAAGLPGGDPLAAILAAGDTPSPEIVAAAGAEGSLRPGIAWTLLLSTVAVVLGTAIFVLPRVTDWGIVPMTKSPEVLANRAEELAEKLGYARPVDKASWFATNWDYRDYLQQNSKEQNWKKELAEKSWPSIVEFCYRQSPEWMAPRELLNSVMVSNTDPPMIISGMVAECLDLQGRLVYFRGLPPQVESEASGREPNWDLLFQEAGLDKSKFEASAPKWLPPDGFDNRADWEGQLPGGNEKVHVVAAAYRGIPIYFAIIGPWDKAWRMPQSRSARLLEWTSSLFAGFIVAYMLVSGYFAWRNIARGRADRKGAIWLAGYVTLSYIVYKLAILHYVPEPSYIFRQINSLGEGLLFGLLTASGYVSAEPYVRRTWPQLMVSWQRLMRGKIRDPMIGRDLLVGIFAGSVTLAITTGAAMVSGKSQILSLDIPFNYGVWPVLGELVFMPAVICLASFIMLALLVFLTGLLRKRWLSLLLTGVFVMLNVGPATLPELLAAAIVAVAFLILLVRFGLVACVGFSLIDAKLIAPLMFGRWYVGLAVIGLLVPMGLLAWSFYLSFGKQSMFGAVLNED